MVWFLKFGMGFEALKGLFNSKKKYKVDYFEI